MAVSAASGAEAAAKVAKPRATAPSNGSHDRKNELQKSHETARPDRRCWTGTEQCRAVLLHRCAVTWLFNGSCPVPWLQKYCTCQSVQTSTHCRHWLQPLRHEQARMGGIDRLTRHLPACHQVATGPPRHALHGLQHKEWGQRRQSCCCITAHHSFHGSKSALLMSRPNASSSRSSSAASAASLPAAGGAAPPLGLSARGGLRTTCCRQACRRPTQHAAQSAP